MYFSDVTKGKEQEIVALFKDTFTASEGGAEGEIVSQLTADLLALEQKYDIRVFTAYDDLDIVGAVIFSRLHYGDTPRSVFLLSPMAVASQRQKQGIGQELIIHSLNQLKGLGADLVLTYGDPAFYSKTGFEPVDEKDISPPHNLSMPQGWIGQALNSKALLPLRERPQCAPPFNTPELW